MPSNTDQNLPTLALTLAQSALANAEAVLVATNPNIINTKESKIINLKKTQSVKDEAAAATQTAVQAKNYSEQNLKNVQEALAIAQLAKEQAINKENIKITLVNEAHNKVTKLQASLMQKQAEITSAEQTKTIADTELVLATNALQKAQKAMLILREATFTNSIRSDPNIRHIDIQRIVINFIQTSYNLIIEKNLSYDSTKDIIIQYENLLTNQLGQLPRFMPPTETNELANTNYVNEYKWRMMSTLNQINKELDKILISSSNQQQNFSNTTILEPFWNDVQTQTELLRNAVAINSNILPIGINTSNNMSMYASVMY